MLVAFLVVVACVVYWQVRKLMRSSSKYKEPPTHPDSWPIIGLLLKVLLNSRDEFWNLLKTLGYDCKQLGGVCMCVFGSWQTVYVVTDPEDAMTVLNTCLEKDVIYKFWKPWMGDGLLTSKVPTWKSHRRLLSPAFNQRLLCSFLPIFNSQSAHMVEQLSEQVGKDSFDIYEVLSRINLETIFMTFMGYKEEDECTLNEYLKAVATMHEITIKRFHNVCFHSDFIYKWSALKKRQDEVLQILHKMSSKMIYNRKSFLNNAIYKKGNDIPDSNTNKIFLDLLIDLNDKGILSDIEVRDQVDTMIFGGFDTSSISLMYTLILLGSHPEVQERVYKELYSTFGDSKAEVTEQDLLKLVYTEAMLKESMRIYPFAPVVVRYIDKDVRLKNCTLSAGGRCIIFLYIMHRHAMWGEDAEVFRPERWLEPGAVPACPGAFAALSWGKRGCIGKRYAMMSMMTLLVHLLLRYRLTADHTQLRFKYEVALLPTAGHLISIERRL